MNSRLRAYAVRSTLATMMVSGSALTGASVFHLQAPGPQVPADAGTHSEFPAGPGRDVTLATCSKCHSPNNILAMGHDRQGWQDLVLKMVDLGASASEEDLGTIVDYLTKSFPAGTAAHINVNTATAPQLVAALTLTADEAKQIVDYREHNGKFKTFDDLKKVPNVDPKKLDAAKEAVVF